MIWSAVASEARHRFTIELTHFDISPDTKTKAPSSLRFAGALQSYL